MKFKLLMKNFRKHKAMATFLFICFLGLPGCSSEKESVKKKDNNKKSEPVSQVETTCCQTYCNQCSTSGQTDNNGEAPASPQAPKPGCRVHFSGGLIGGYFQSNGVSEVYEEDDFSEYVGAGAYPDNTKAFPKAVKSTFDGIAIDTNTRVIIYSEKDFQGEILIDRTGPAIINNSKFDTAFHNLVFGYRDNVEGEWEEPLQSNYPHSVREWSDSDMHKWDTGSLKVICQ